MIYNYLWVSAYPQISLFQSSSESKAWNQPNPSIMELGGIDYYNGIYRNSVYSSDILPSVSYFKFLIIATLKVSIFVQ